MGRGGLLEPVRWRWLPFERNLAVLAVMHGSDQNNLERVWNWKFGILRSLPRSTPSSRSTSSSRSTPSSRDGVECVLCAPRERALAPVPSISIWLANGAKVGTLVVVTIVGTFLIWFELGSATTFQNLFGCVSGREDPESNERTNGWLDRDETDFSDREKNAVVLGAIETGRSHPSVTTAASLRSVH